jgi:hypothetical protein
MREFCEAVESAERRGHLLSAIRGNGAFGRFKTLAAAYGMLVRIPMMPITQSDLMSISAERSDAGLSQCERVIDISQDVFRFSARFCVEGAGLLQ